MPLKTNDTEIPVRWKRVSFCSSHCAKCQGKFILRFWSMHFLTQFNELNTPPKICWCTANDKTLSWEFDNSRPLTTNWSTEGFLLYWKHKWTSASATPAWAMCGLTVFPAIPRYGQMTAGSYCYIGPQGIVHGTVVRNWGKVSVSTFWRRLSPAVAGDGSGLDCCERIFWLLKKFSLPGP